jgi:hypothetical protein
MTKKHYKLLPGPKLGYIVVFGVSDWSRIEAAYGHVLPDDARKLISLATLVFTLSLPVERWAPKVGSLDDVLAEIDHLIESADKLREKMFPPHYWQLEYNYLEVPRRIETKMAIQLEAIEDKPDNDRDVFRISLTGLIESGSVVVDRARKHRVAQEGDSWDCWVVWLGLIVKAFGLPDGIRKDVYRIGRGKPSAEPSEFIAFLKALQGIACPDYHRSGSDGGIAKAVQRARQRLGLPESLHGGGTPKKLQKVLLEAMGLSHYPKMDRQDPLPLEQAIVLAVEGKTPGIFPFISEPPVSPH